jgi:uncharacterized protein (DUF433 family)
MEFIMNLPDFLVEWPFGAIMLKGHRISMYHVVTAHQRGWTPERILEEYPSLSLEKINNVLAFYEQNRAEVDEHIRACEEEMDRFVTAFPQKASREELLRYFEAKKQKD